jgi:general stress protein 13
LKIGDIIHGTVSGLKSYGIFVTFADHQQGLIHISEISNSYISSITDFVEIGQLISAQIIDIDQYSHKISLSMRTLSKKAAPIKHHQKRMFTDYHKKIGFVTIEKSLYSWIEEALTNLQDK